MKHDGLENGEHGVYHEAGAALMALSTIIVAVNARFLKVKK